MFCDFTVAKSKFTNSSSSSALIVCLWSISFYIFGGERAKYSSSADVVGCAKRDKSIDRRFNDPSGTASLFSSALSSCSFVREEKNPLEVIAECKDDFLVMNGKSRDLLIADGIFQTGLVTI